MVGDVDGFLTRRGVEALGLVLVAVDEDIDVFNEPDVLWAMHTYVNPDRDIDIIKNVGESVFTTCWQRSKVIVDATRPSDVAFASRFSVPADVMDRINLDEWIESVSGSNGSARY